MSRPRNDVPLISVTVMLRYDQVAQLDDARNKERAASGIYVDRSTLIAAVIESADLPSVVRGIAAMKAT